MEEHVIDAAWFQVCTLEFAKATTEEQLIDMGRRLARTPGVNQETLVVLRVEYREQLKRLRHERRSASTEEF